MPFVNGSKGLATRESGHRIVIIAAATIATMTPAMMARCNGLLAMGPKQREPGAFQHQIHAALRALPRMYNCCTPECMGQK